LICDDREVWLAGLQAVVESVPDLVVVGHAASCTRAVELSRQLTLDVAVVSQTMEGDAGRVVQTLSRGGVPVIVLSPARTDRGVLDAPPAGARCCLTDAVAPAQLIAAIRAAARRE
jgi:DNA-binding NarL/FixJ family response regulator